MIDSNTFKELREELEEYHVIKSDVLDKARKVVVLSKQVIYAQQSGESESAANHLHRMEEEYRDLLKSVERRPDLTGHGSVRTAGQEFVEASSYLAIEQERDLPRAEELGVDALTYVLGISDLSGELVRSAVLASIDGNHDRVQALRDALNSLYGKLITITYREGDLRRKIDKVGYDLEKVENLILDLQKR